MPIAGRQIANDGVGAKQKLQTTRRLSVLTEQGLHFLAVGLRLGLLQRFFSEPLSAPGPGGGSGQMHLCGSQRAEGCRGMQRA